LYGYEQFDISLEIHLEVLIFLSSYIPLRVDKDEGMLLGN